MRACVPVSDYVYGGRRILSYLMSVAITSSSHSRLTFVHSIIHSMTSSSTKHEESLGPYSILMCTTMCAYLPMRRRRRTSHTQGKLSRGATIRGTSIYFLHPAGRLVSSFPGLQHKSNTWEIRYLTLKRTTGSTPYIRCNIMYAVY